MGHNIGMSEGPPLRVALVLPFYDPRRGDDPQRIIALQPTLAGIAAAEAARGMQVGAFQLFPRSAQFEQAGATFDFVPAPAAFRAAARWLYRAWPRYASPYYEPAAPLWSRVGAWRPDILHVFGLTLDLNLLLAGQLARRSGKPLVVHYHGGLPEADPVTLAVRRHNLRAAARVLFTSREQAAPWIRAGLLAPSRVAEVVETSTAIQPIPRAAARALTGMRGEPCCVMVGRLHAVKDPLTALAGFALIARQRPLARLYIYSLSDELRPYCEAIVAATPALARRVEFRGRVAPERMPAVYSSADFLLQASRREWSGLSVLEAMACGTIPIVSDIPAFRRMTGHGRYGRLFPVGDPRGLARAVLDLKAEERAELSGQVRSYFQGSLSFAALARDLEAIYRHVARAPGNGT